MEIRLIPTVQRPGNNTPSNICIELIQNGETLECYGSSAQTINRHLNTELHFVNGQPTTKFPLVKADILFPKLVKLGYKIAINQK